MEEWKDGRLRPSNPLGFENRYQFMNDHLSVETPEQINLNFQKAGIGSRFFAALIDTIVLILISFVGTYVNEQLLGDMRSALGNWVAAINGIIVFCSILGLLYGV